ncbi:MAG: hypothetical protein ACRDV9_12095 [Acidimicrobiia bacterium]
MAKDPDPTTLLHTLDGKSRSLDDWTTMFHMLLVVMPARPEVAPYLAIGSRILHVFQGADCRGALLVTNNADHTRRILGDAAERFLVFVDPQRQVVESLGLTRLPALVHLRQDASLAEAVEGWDPPAWRALSARLATEMSWSHPMLPAPGDPPAFVGWAA